MKLDYYLKIFDQEMLLQEKICEVDDRCADSHWTLYNVRCGILWFFEFKLAEPGNC